MMKKMFLSCTLRSVVAYFIVKGLLRECSLLIALALVRSSGFFPASEKQVRKKARFNNMSL